MPGTMHPAIADGLPKDGCCSTKGCGKLGAFMIGAKVWAVGFPHTDGTALVMQTPLLACVACREKPPLTAAEFFLPDTRAGVTRQAIAFGLALPDFDSAEWDFTPIETPSKGEAN